VPCVLCRNTVVYVRLICYCPSTLNYWTHTMFRRSFVQFNASGLGVCMLFRQLPTLQDTSSLMAS
jgi:hypothetical protein